MASSVTHSPIDGMQRKENHLARAKAAELRAIHAAFLQRGDRSSGEMEHSSARSSLLSRFYSQFSPAAEDYPIFTPTYEGQQLPGFHRNFAENWSGSTFSESRGDEIDLSDTISMNKLSPLKYNQMACVADEHFSIQNLYHRQSPVMKRALGADVFKSSSMRSATEVLKNVPFSTATSWENGVEQKNLQCVNNKTPSLETRIPSVNSQSKSKGASFSWWFHKSKKKTKLKIPSYTDTKSEAMPQPLKDWELLSLEALKKELFEANEQKDAALSDVSEMRYSIGQLQQKLETLESYCKELKKSLKLAIHEQERVVLNTSKGTKPIFANLSCDESSMPVGHDVMVEGFLQVVSEARLSVKHFCKTLIDNMDRSYGYLQEKLGILLPLNPNEKCSKSVIYHLESLINKLFHQDFENCAFQSNGTPRLLDPHDDRLENFSSFVALRNLSWNEALKQGAEHYSDDFSRFCNQKMNSIVSMLNWSKPFPELLLQSFFVACKCIWLLHLLAFSFNPPLMILRVAENGAFNPLYMEDVVGDRQQRAQFSVQVKAMVMPGFFVHDKVLKSRVLCRYG